MAEPSFHIFPAAQAAYLRNREALGAVRRVPPADVSFVAHMPPVAQQALRGTCVASAVTTLLEYYWDCKLRLSVQYLHEITKGVERAGLERNLAAVRNRTELDAPFKAVFKSQLAQLDLLFEANGADSPVLKPFLDQFEAGVRERFAKYSGTLLCSCFKAVETQGVCRHALWPYAAATAETPFGDTALASFPPGTHEDAAKHRVTSGRLYLLRTPNNVDEIRGILRGANGRRPMPVCVTIEDFDGFDAGGFDFPPVSERDGALGTTAASKGLHAVLIVGCRDNAAEPGGGHFTVRNSWGETWGRNGYGTLSYAYLECFCSEAGTILQDSVDYLGDGYGGTTTIYDFTALRDRIKTRKRTFWPRLIVQLLLAGALVALTVAICLLVR